MAMDTDVLTCPACQRPHVASVSFTAVSTPTREDVLRLEAKLDALVVALRAGAVGKWTP